MNLLNTILRPIAKRKGPEKTDAEKKMEKVRDAQLLGFSTDDTGAYGIVLGGVYLCCFVDTEDGMYEVTVDGVDEHGDFARNIEWESFNSAHDAITCLKEFVKKYAPQIEG